MLDEERNEVLDRSVSQVVGGSNDDCIDVVGVGRVAVRAHESSVFSRRFNVARRWSIRQIGHGHLPTHPGSAAVNASIEQVNCSGAGRTETSKARSVMAPGVTAQLVRRAADREPAGVLRAELLDGLSGSAGDLLDRGRRAVIPIFTMVPGHGGDVLVDVRSEVGVCEYWPAHVSKGTST